MGLAPPKFIVVLMIALLAAPCATVAQQTTKVSRIGFLGPTTAHGVAPGVEAFRASLRDLGHVEGKNVVIEYRWADDKYDRLPALAEELVRLKIDVLVTFSTPGALAAKRATTTIPIVMVQSGDAVRTGIIASLARPGGNITGSTFMGPELYAKQLDLLKAVVPGLKRVARLVNPANTAVATIYEDEERAARSQRIEASHLEVRDPGEFDAVFAAAVREGVEAVVIGNDPMIFANSRAIADVAAKKRLPSIGRPQFAEAGGMIGFGPDPLDTWRRAPYFVDRILKGAKPADLPVQQPTKFELVINLKTAKALGLTIPPSLLLQADRVVE